MLYENQKEKAWIKYGRVANQNNYENVIRQNEEKIENLELQIAELNVCFFLLSITLIKIIIFKSWIKYDRVANQNNYENVIRQNKEKIENLELQIAEFYVWFF